MVARGSGRHAVKRVGRLFGRLVATDSFAAAAVVAAHADAFDDLQLWASADTVYSDGDDLDLAVSGEIWLNEDGSRLFFARLTHEVRYSLGETWTLQGGASYILFRLRDLPETHNFRIEGAATGKWSWSDGTSFDLRHQLEAFWFEGSLDDEVRLRIRPRVKVPLSSRQGGPRYVFSNEFLFRDEGSKYFQNRFQPVGVDFRTGPQSRMELYAMVFSLRVEDDWRHDLVLGASVHF